MTHPGKEVLFVGINNLPDAPWISGWCEAAGTQREERKAKGGRISPLTRLQDIMQKAIKLLTKANHIFDRSLSATAIMAGVLIIFLMMGTLAEVISRYFFNSPIPWMLEVLAYSLVWITFLGVAWLLKREGHVNMDVFLVRFKPRTRCLVNIITSALGVLVCAVLVWSTAENLRFYIEVGHLQQTERYFPTAPIFVIIPIGSFLLFIQFLRRTYGYVASWRGLPDQEQETQAKTRV